MLVSICMATYNGGKFIREQVDSILNQQFVENKDVELELVVSDDGSTDNTIDILKSYQDPRIKVFLHSNKKKYRYLNATRACKCNFENAMSKALGDYIFLSDQDDFWYPSKIDKQLSVLRKYGGVNAAAFDMGDGELRKINTLIYRHNIPFFTTSNPQSIGFSGILLAKRQNSFYCTYFLHNRNVADTKSPYPIKRLEVIRRFNQKDMAFNQSLS